MDHQLGIVCNDQKYLFLSLRSINPTHCSDSGMAQEKQSTGGTATKDT